MKIGYAIIRRMEMEKPIEKLRQLQKDVDKQRKDLMIECDMLQGNINR